MWWLDLGLNVMSAEWLYQIKSTLIVCIYLKRPHEHILVNVRFSSLGKLLLSFLFLSCPCPWNTFIIRTSPLIQSREILEHLTHWKLFSILFCGSGTTSEVPWVLLGLRSVLGKVFASNMPDTFPIHQALPLCTDFLKIQSYFRCNS